MQQPRGTKARENIQPVPSAGKLATGAKRGKKNSRDWSHWFSASFVNGNTGLFVRARNAISRNAKPKQNVYITVKYFEGNLCSQLNVLAEWTVGCSRPSDNGEQE